METGISKDGNPLTFSSLLLNTTELVCLRPFSKKTQASWRIFTVSQITFFFSSVENDSVQTEQNVTIIVACFFRENSLTHMGIVKRTSALTNTYLETGIAWFLPPSCAMILPFMLDQLSNACTESRNSISFFKTSCWFGLIMFLSVGERGFVVLPPVYG